jgi:DNA-binding CsgD family transcriptional regulator
MYGVGTGKTLHRDERYFVWATVPPEWIAEYDQKSYVEIDPRVTHAWDTLPPPLIWDSRIANGDPKIEEFLERAAKFGIGSGVAIYLHDDDTKVLVALNQPERTITENRRAEMSRVIGDAMQLATIFHLIFMKAVVASGIAPIQQGRPLSARECQCLTLAARGMTSYDIGLKLSITERTVNFHFSNIVSKLGALNRKEAIAMGMAHGLIHVDLRIAALQPQRPSKFREAQLKRWENLRKRRR